MEFKGMRYVPKIMDEWISTIPYEPLMVVSYTDGNSYISKTYPPTGTLPTNKTYWLCCGKYNVQVEQYKDSVDGVIDELAKKLRYVTPEMYGAVGDGVIDDTTAINNAIIYGITNGYNVIANSKKYLVSSVVVNVASNSIFDIQVDFKNAMLYSNNIAPIILIGGRSYKKNIDFKNCNIEYTGSGNIITIRGRNVNLYNINIYAKNSCTGFLVDTDSHGNYIQNVTAHADVGLNCTLIEIKSADSEFSNIRGWNWKTGIKTVGSTMFSNVHLFLNSEYLSDHVRGESTVFCISDGRPIFNQCYSDTYATSFYINSGAPLISNSTVFINPNFYNAANGFTKKPILFDGVVSFWTSIVNSFICGTSELDLIFSTTFYSGIYNGLQMSYVDKTNFNKTLNTIANLTTTRNVLFNDGKNFLLMINGYAASSLKNSVQTLLTDAPTDSESSGVFVFTSINIESEMPESTIFYNGRIHGGTTIKMVIPNIDAGAYFKCTVLLKRIVYTY